MDIDKISEKLTEAKQPRREFVQLMEEFKAGRLGFLEVHP